MLSELVVVSGKGDVEVEYIDQTEVIARDSDRKSFPDWA